MNPIIKIFLNISQPNVDEFVCDIFDFVNLSKFLCSTIHLSRGMGDHTTTEEVIETVLRRSAFLSCLESGPKDKRTLVEELDYSRSTVDRGIRELEAFDLVEYENGSYGITSVGAGVMANFTRFTDATQQWIRLEPFLRWVDEEALTFDYRHLDDADVVVAEPGDPYAVINRHVKRLQMMEKGRFLLPFVGLHATETGHKRVVDHGAECELVVASDVATTLRENSEYAELFQEMVATDRLHIYRADHDLPIAVGLIDDRVQIIAADGQQPRALVETAHDEVYEWASETFEMHKRRAESYFTPQTSEPPRT